MREVTLHSSPDSMGGAKRFPNTRVPVSLFFLNLAEGVGIDQFCRGYPRVDPEDCRRVLAAAQRGIEGRDGPRVEHEEQGGHRLDEVAHVRPKLLFLRLAEGMGIDQFCHGYPRIHPDDCRRVLAAAQEYIEERDEPSVEQERRESRQPRYGEDLFQRSAQADDAVGWP